MTRHAVKASRTQDELRDGELTFGGQLSVEKVVRPFILECPPEFSIRDAARRMSESQCGSILVVEQGRTVGIWTERDALAMDFSDPASHSRPIGEVMSAPVRTIPPETTLQEAAVRFREERVRHFLVVNASGKRVGIVSQTDVVLNQGIEHFMRMRSISSILKNEVVRVGEDASIPEVTRRMRESGTDAVIVDFSDASLGIITERDLLRAVAGQKSADRAGRLATRPLISISDAETLYRARSVLVESRIRHLAVSADDGALRGVISFSDILDGIELAYVHELQRALLDRNHALANSRRNLRLAEKIIENSLDGIVITDRYGRIESVNPAFTRLTGYLPEEVVGRNPSVLSSGRHGPSFYRAMWEELNRNGGWQGEIWNRRKNGEIYPELLTITAIQDEQGELSHFAAIFSDISAIKENEERIKHLAYFDPLTGLPNRRLFLDRLGVAVAHARRSQLQLAVMFVDLDRFKRINDSLGHAVGDRLLLEAAGVCTRG